jgi:hypothetical protein
MKLVETNGFTDLGVGARLWRRESGTHVKFTHAASRAVRLSGAITLIAMGALSFFAFHRRSI